MKTLVFSIIILFSGSAFAGQGTGGTPSVPCYINGEYQGTIQITICHRMGGKVPGENGWRERQ